MMYFIMKNNKPVRITSNIHHASFFFHLAVEYSVVAYNRDGTEVAFQPTKPYLFPKRIRKES